MFKSLMIFVSGAAIGYFVGWKLTRDKYESIIQDAVDSEREYYSKKYGEKEETSEDSEEEDTEDPDEEYVKDLIREYGGSYEEKENKVIDYDNYEPYVIPPEEFGSLEYTEISYTYYSDGVLVDEDDNMVENADELIGFDSLGHFGEYEDDSVYVRNDILKIDFEILLDQRTYEETR